MGRDEKKFGKNHLFVRSDEENGRAGRESKQQNRSKSSKSCELSCGLAAALCVTPRATPSSTRGCKDKAYSGLHQVRKGTEELTVTPEDLGTDQFSKRPFFGQDRRSGELLSTCEKGVQSKKKDDVPEERNADDVYR